MYDPNFKEDTIPAPVEKKQDLDQNYYPLNYVSNYGKDAPTLVDNLVAPPVRTNKENKGGDTKEDKREGKGDKMVTEEEVSGEDVDNDNYQITQILTTFIR